MTDLFSQVRPKGWLGKRLKNVANPRKHRWNAYLRACRAIPMSSPVHGTTNWKKINHRRGQLIGFVVAGKLSKDDPEFSALQRVCGEIGCGPGVASNFLMRRYLRRIKREIKAKGFTVSP